MSISHCTFWVTRARLEVRLRKREVESRASFTGTLPAADPGEEAGQDERPHHHQDQHQANVGVGGHDAPDQDDQTGGGQDRPYRVEGAGRVRGQRIGDAAGQDEDDRR